MIKSKKTLFIHIGYHKTGTTSLQKWLDINRNILRSHSIDYVPLECIASNHATYALCLNPSLVKICKQSGLFLGLTEKNRYSSTQYEPDLIYSNLVEYVEKTNYRNYIISSECFLEGIDMNLFHSLLCDVSFDVKIVAYIRPQDSWIKSVYKYVVMDPDLRYSGSIEQLPQTEMLNFHEAICQFSEKFGDTNIILRNYSRLQGRRTGLVHDFLDIVGFSQSNEARESFDFTEVSENQSFLDSEVCFLNLLWRFERATGLRIKTLENRIYERKLSFLRGGKIKVRWSLLSKYMKSNHLLKEKFPDLDTKGLLK